MKRIIFTGLLLKLTVCIASAKAPKPNTDLIGSWQHITTYTQKQKPSYQKTENYLFYSDNTCNMQTIIENCLTGAITKKNIILRWLVLNNYIVLLNSHGKTEREFIGNGNLKNILTGQRLILQSNELEKEEAEKLFADYLKSEQVSYIGQKP